MQQEKIISKEKETISMDALTMYKMLLMGQTDLMSEFGYRTYANYYRSEIMQLIRNKRSQLSDVR